MSLYYLGLEMINITSAQSLAHDMNPAVRKTGICRTTHNHSVSITLLFTLSLSGEKLKSFL